MFNITGSMQSYWDEKKEPKATHADITKIEADLSIVFSVPYVEFITQFGFVIFGENCDGFDYSITFPDRQEMHQGDLAFLHNPDQIIMCYRNMIKDLIEEGCPAIPDSYLPIGNDEGQGQILLKMDGEDTGSVWYWPYNEWAWGTETNTWLGFVAKDFYEFINKLRPNTASLRKNTVKSCR